mgnify:CR=1 FL=1
MKLNKMKKEDLELMSYGKLAELYLKENKKTLTTAELFKEICNLLELSEEEYQNKIADFFQTLTTSKEFILLNDGKWDLKANHTFKIDIDEIYEEKDEEVYDDESSEEDEEKEEDEEDEDYDITDDSEFDEELGDLSIVTEDELNEE